MDVIITPASSYSVPSSGPQEFSLPPDKSLLHRVLLIGSLTQTAFEIPIPSQSAISHDVVATVLALESLGVPVELFDRHIELQGVGRKGYRMPTHLINCANSGTTARLLMGLLSGQSFNSALTGDDSLSARPMKRLADQLAKLGARIVTTPEGTLPLMVTASRLNGAHVSLPVASAQMKSAILLAGLLGQGLTSVSEPWQSRDHTERMLEAFGFEIDCTDERILIDPVGQPDLPDTVRYVVPGDPSSAAFLAAAAVLLKRNVILKGVLLNPTRTRFFDYLTLMGVDLEMQNVAEEWGEEHGDIVVRGNEAASSLLPFHVTADDVPLLIDELPLLSILGVFADGESTIEGASELRNKESDRIRAVVTQLTAYGVVVAEHASGLAIQGAPGRTLQPCSIDHHGDHRLAMCFALLALFASDESVVHDGEVVSVSYPEFYQHLSALIGEDHVRIQ